MAYTLTLPAPPNVEVDDSEALTIALEWDIVNFAASYQIEQTLVNRTTGATTVTTHSVTARAYAYTYTNADSATYSTVQFRLKSIAPTGTVFADSDFSDDIIIAIDDETARLAKTQNVRTANTATNLIVAWDAVARATSYALEITTIETETDEPRTIVRSIAPPQGSTTVPTTYDLGTIARFQQNFQRVDVRVTALGDDPDGEASDVLMWDVPTPVDRPARRLLLAEPTGVFAEINIEASRITLTWDAVPNAVLYEIERVATARDGTQTTTYRIQSGESFTPSYTADNRRDDASYTYRIRALGYPPVRDRISTWSDRVAVELPTLSPARIPMLPPTITNVALSDYRTGKRDYLVFYANPNAPGVPQTNIRFQLETTRLSVAGVRGTLSLRQHSRGASSPLQITAGTISTHGFDELAADTRFLEFRMRGVLIFGADNPTSTSSPFGDRFFAGVPEGRATPFAEAPDNGLTRLATPETNAEVITGTYGSPTIDPVVGAYSYDVEYRTADGVAGHAYWRLNAPAIRDASGKIALLDVNAAQVQAFRIRANPVEGSGRAPSLWSETQSIGAVGTVVTYAIAFSNVTQTNLTATSSITGGTRTGQWQQRRRRKDQTAWTTLPEQASAAFSHTGLTQDTTYVFETRIGGGAWGGQTEQTTESATALGTTALSLSSEDVQIGIGNRFTQPVRFTAVADATDYDLYLSTTNTATPPGTATASSDASFNTATRTVTVTNLDPETTYYAWARARTATRTGAWGTRVSFTTARALTAPAMTRVRWTSVGSGAAQLQQGTIEGVTHDSRMRSTDAFYFLHIESSRRLTGLQIRFVQNEATINRVATSPPLGQYRWKRENGNVTTAKFGRVFGPAFGPPRYDDFEDVTDWTPSHGSNIIYLMDVYTTTGLTLVSEMQTFNYTGSSSAGSSTGTP